MTTTEALETRAQALYDDMTEALGAFHKSYYGDHGDLPTLKELGVGPQDLRAVTAGHGADAWERLAWADVRLPPREETDGEYHEECLADYIEAAETFLATLDALIPCLEPSGDEDGEAEE